MYWYAVRGELKQCMGLVIQEVQTGGAGRQGENHGHTNDTQKQRVTAAGQGKLMRSSGNRRYLTSSLSRRCRSDTVSPLLLDVLDVLEVPVAVRCVAVCVGADDRKQKSLNVSSCTPSRATVTLPTCSICHVHNTQAIHVDITAIHGR